MDDIASRLNGAMPALPEGDLWVFGYGSVMWRPGFGFAESHPGRVFGYHRALCVWSWYHRGTRARPGLVMGLDVGGSCLGRVFRVAAADKQATAEYLLRRELVTPAYLPVLNTVYCNGRAVRALGFKVDRRHPQYAGRLSVQRAVDTVRGAEGASGANPEYIANTMRQLDELGVRDPFLAQVHARLLAGPAASTPVRRQAAQ